MELGGGKKKKCHPVEREDNKNLLWCATCVKGKETVTPTFHVIFLFGDRLIELSIGSGLRLTLSGSDFPEKSVPDPILRINL